MPRGGDMNNIKTTIFLSCLTGILLALGHILGGDAGMVVALIIAGIMNFSAYWFSDQIILKMYDAHQIKPNHPSGLFEIIEKISLKANIPMPRVFVINESTPNAFATGRNPDNAAIAATTGLLSILDKDELTGVMAHEITHIINRDTFISSIAATIAGAITMLANMAQFVLIFGHRGGNEDDNNYLSSLLIMVIAPIAAGLIQLAVSRSREYAADEGAAQLTGNPLPLARALEKLENNNYYRIMPITENNPSTAHMFIINPLKNTSIRSVFSTHPPTESRVNRLKEMYYKKIFS